MNVSWKGPAQRDLRGIDPTHARRILDAVDRFAATGQGDVKRLRGSDGIRLRVGDYRVRFVREGETIVVLHVDHRREAYR